MNSQLEKFTACPATELTEQELLTVDGGNIGTWIKDSLKGVVEGVKSAYEFAQEVGGDMYRAMNKNAMRCK